MGKKNNNVIILIISIVAVALIVLSIQPQINVNVPSGDGSSGDSSGTGGDSYYYYENPPVSDSSSPSSLYVVVEPNPVTMGNWVYGSVTSDGYKYPITIHAKHVGENLEQTFGALIDEHGQFYHSQTLDTPGYWDFWATADGVTSNKPRLTVRGAMLTSSKTFFSRSFGDMTTTIKVYSHSTGNCQIFANDPDAGISIPITTVNINSGGFASANVDFTGWSLGSYELDMVVNGIKASDYSASVWITLGR